VHSPLHHQICPTFHFQVNHHHLCSSLHSPTKKDAQGSVERRSATGSVGETHSMGRRMWNCMLFCYLFPYNCLAAHTVSPTIETNQHLHGAHPYRQDLQAPHAQPQFFDLDLDLNPDLWCSYVFWGTTKTRLLQKWTCFWNQHYTCQTNLPFNYQLWYTNMTPRNDRE